MLKKNLFYNSLMSISNFIFPLITFPYSSRILGPGGIGSVNFIDSITAYFILVAALGIPTYAVREIAKRQNDEQARNKVASEILTIHVASAIIFSICYLICGLVVPTLRQHLDLVFVGIGLIFINVFSVDWFFQGMQKFKYIGLRSLFSKTLSVVCLYVFLRKGSPSIVYYLIGASGPAFNSLLNMINFRKYCKLQFSNLSFRPHIKPLVTILSSSLAASVYFLLDSIILGFIKGDVAVGIYSTALRIARIPFAIIGAIAGVMIPQVSYAYSNQNFDEIKAIIHKSFSFICVVGMPIAVGMYLMSDSLIMWFAGSSFMEAALVIKILSPLIIIVGFTNLFAIQLLNPIGKERRLLRIVLVAMVFSVVSNFFLITAFSFIGAAVTTIVTEIIVTVLSYLAVRKYLPVSFDFRILMHTIIAAAWFVPLSIVIRTIPINTDVREILLIVACVIVYFTYIWIFANNIYIKNAKQDLLKRVGIAV
jgi:O-antigen/teichoic acid export membrane protein